MNSEQNPTTKDEWDRKCARWRAGLGAEPGPPPSTPPTYRYEDGWQYRTINRLQRLGLGFRFGPGIKWFPVDGRGHPVAGPFHTPEAFDTWLEGAETDMT